MTRHTTPEQLRRTAPVEFSYSPFNHSPDSRTWQRFQDMPGLSGVQGFQLVDLYGEGLPGVLYQSDTGWYYREPIRAKAKTNEVTYDQWQALPQIPVCDTTKPLHQALSDLTGDGRLDWVIAQPGLNGFFLGADRSWSDFATFHAFPAEFFHPQGQLADLMGEGLSDLALIGPRSIRLYAHQRERGFAQAEEVLTMTMTCRYSPRHPPSWWRSVICSAAASSIWCAFVTTK